MYEQDASDLSLHVYVATCSSFIDLFAAKFGNFRALISPFIGPFKHLEEHQTVALDVRSLAITLSRFFFLVRKNR